jgi:hypothetical protein
MSIPNDMVPNSSGLDRFHCAILLVFFFITEQSGLQFGDKILEVNNISLHSLPSSSAVKVLTGSNQLKLMIDRTGRVPEWRLSRERTVW